MTPRAVALTLALFLTLLYSLQWQYLSFTPEPATTIPVGELGDRTTFWADSDEYVAMVVDLSAAIPPHRYRVLPALLARWLGWPAEAGYLALNSLCFVFVGVGFTAYLLRYFPYPLALLGGVLAVTTASLQRTVLFPSVDPMTYAAALAVFAALPYRRAWVYAAIAALAVLVKEIFVAAIPVWIAYHGFRREAVWLALPALTYAGTRLALGGGALDANYGYSLFAPPVEYLRRLYAFPDLPYTLARSGMALGALWIGLWGLRRVDRALWRAGLAWCALVVPAAVLYSSHIIRVIGIVYPPLIIGVLRLLKE